MMATPRPAGRRPSTASGVRVEQPLARRQVDALGCRRRPRWSGGRKGVAGRKDGLDRGQDVRFGPAERRQSGGRQPRLQWTQVAAPKGKIVEEVQSARPVLRVDVLQQVRGVVDQPQHVVPQGFDLANEPVGFVDRVRRFRISHVVPVVPIEVNTV